MFYDGASAGPLCSWMSNPGFDFFVIEKHRPCCLTEAVRNYDLKSPMPYKCQ